MLHERTGRTAEITVVPHLSGAQLRRGASGGRFVLFVATDDNTPGIQIEAARRLIEQGIGYVCAWGPIGEDIEESFDYATFMPECGPEFPFTLMTTAHRDSLEEALEFAFCWAQPAGDLAEGIDHVVVAAATEQLRSQCEAWLHEENQKQ